MYTPRRFHHPFPDASDSRICHCGVVTSKTPSPGAAVLENTKSGIEGEGQRWEPHPGLLGSFKIQDVSRAAGTTENDPHTVSAPVFDVVTTDETCMSFGIIDRPRQFGRHGEQGKSDQGFR
jgi:hypothetical protein